MAPTPNKASHHWADEEVDRLALSCCAVSTEKGGVGSNMEKGGLWLKVTRIYHSSTGVGNTGPPVPRNNKGRACLPRNLSSL